MGTKRLIGLVLLFGAICLAISCSDDNHGVGPQPEDTTLYVDEAILIDTTAAIYISGEEVDRLIFNLDSVPMFVNGDFDDIYISYFAGDGVDRANVVFNFGRQEWDTLVSDPGSVLGNMEDVFGHMVSKMGIPLSDLINDSLHMYMQPWYLSFSGFKKNPPPPYSMKGVQLNDHYSPLYIPNSDHTFFRGITFDGQTYWLAAMQSGVRQIWQISASGQILSRFDSPAEFPNDMALGGNGIWISDASYGPIDTSSQVWKIGLDGEILCRFIVPSSYAGALAYGGGSIWLNLYSPHSSHVLQIDPEASCASGAAEILNTFDIGKPIESLAWDGTNLLAASDSLYVVSTDGTILKAYAWTVGGDQRIDYYNGYLHVFCAGPAGLNLDDRVIVKLKMR